MNRVRLRWRRHSEGQRRTLEPEKRNSRPISKSCTKATCTPPGRNPLDLYASTAATYESVISPRKQSISFQTLPMNKEAVPSRLMINAVSWYEEEVISGPSLLLASSGMPGWCARPLVVLG